MLEASRLRAAARPRERAVEASLHPGAWLAWLLAATVVAFAVSNPLYLTLALLACGGAYLAVRDTPKGRALTPFVALGLALATLSVPFNLLTGSPGQRELVELPSLTFPQWFGGVTLGGPLTGEALVAAGSRALSIGTLVLAAAAFNSAVDHFRLLKLAPRGLGRLMLVFTVAAVVIPQAFAQARAVSEGQRLRGHRSRGLKAVPGLVLPVLQGALERSIQRAESLEARGFGGGETEGSTAATLVGVAGLGIAAWGAFSHFYYGPGIAAALAMALGAALVVAALYRGRTARASAHRRSPLAVRDVALLAIAATTVVLVLAMRVAGIGEAAYIPYPLEWPAFHALGALCAALLLAPALLSPPPDGEGHP